jgi:hypothetical protein
VLLLGRPVDPRKATVASTRLCRWSADERPVLFDTLQYNKTPEAHLVGCLPKIGTAVEENIWTKLFHKSPPLSASYSPQDTAVVYYSRKVNSFLQILDFVPEVRDGKGHLRPPSEFKTLCLRTKNEALAVYCMFNSTLFRWFMDVVSDGSHLNRREVDNFPFDPREALAVAPALPKLAASLTSSLKRTSEKRVMRYAHDTLTVQCIIPKFSKPIIDDIDRCLARFYDFSDEELDFVINYDIKYRMGGSDDDTEE